MSGIGAALLALFALNQVPPLCERQLGVCAGARHAQLPDGGYEPVCTSLSYGPDYEVTESRCDGLDNDCDGQPDQWWKSLTPLEAPNGSFPLAYASIPGGFVIATENAAGTPLLRYRDALGAPLRPDVTFTGWSAGFIRSFNLVRTADGLLLDIGPSSAASTFVVHLDGDGLPLEAPRAISLPHPASFVTAAASSDGTRVLLLLIQQTGPAEILGLTLDAQGLVRSGPAVVMTKRFDTQPGFNVGWPVGTAPDRFVMVAYEDTQAPFSTSYVRTLPLSESLRPTGPERVFQTWSQLQVKLLPPSSPGPWATVPLLYRDIEGGLAIVRLIPNVLGRYPGPAQLWLQIPADQLFFTAAAGSGQGPVLAWQALQLANGQTTYQWDVGAAGDGLKLNLDPPGQVLVSPSLPFIYGMSRERPDAWTALLANPHLDGTTELDATTWCSP